MRFQFENTRGSGTGAHDRMQKELQVANMTQAELDILKDVFVERAHLESGKPRELIHEERDAALSRTRFSAVELTLSSIVAQALTRIEDQGMTADQQIDFIKKIQSALIRYSNVSTANLVAGKNDNLIASFDLSDSQAKSLQKFLILINPKVNDLRKVLSSLATDGSAGGSIPEVRVHLQPTNDKSGNVLFEGVLES